MRGRLWGTAMMTIVLSISTIFSTSSTYAEEARTIYDESIYEVFVDRYFNATNGNDYEVDTQNPAAFAGGDFIGMRDKMDYIVDLGFTTVAIGSVFSTETYDGSRITSYETIERHFGTAQELQQLIDTFKERHIRTMMDWRLNHVSSNHEWAIEHPEWVSEEQDGSITWDYTNEAFIAALTEAVQNMQSTYNAGAIRFTQMADVPADVVATLIATIREQTEDVQIVITSEKDVDADAVIRIGDIEQWGTMFQTTGQSTAMLPQLIAPQTPATIAAVDTLETERITYKAAEQNAFPPTRIKVAMGALLTMPTVPLMTYGTEISMNGHDATTSHQIQNFKVEEEIIGYIQDVQKIRNQSAALRTGDFELLTNKDGFIVFKRWNNEEQWIVAINNTSETQRVQIPIDEIGDDKQLSGLFEKDIVRQDEDGYYSVVIDREIVELYQVKDDEGFNIAYMMMMALVYIIFLAFIWALLRRGKKRS